MRHFFVLLIIGWLARCALAAQPVLIAIDPLKPGDAISADFLGLSYETAQVLPRDNGSHYFSPENKPLIEMFKTIGVKSLRIGGNSVDQAKTAIPSEADLDSLFAFSQAAGVKIIYSVRLEDGNAESAAQIAKYIGNHYADRLDCFAIGNEPSYFKTYDAYRDHWKAMHDAMLAAAPNAKFCGPDTNPNPAWCKNLVEEFGNHASGPSGALVMIAQHDYPGGCAYKNSKATDIKDLIPVDAAAVREKMLSNDWYSRYTKVQQGMADAVAGTPVSFRLTETNSLWYGGLQDASDSFASALWGVDYLYWWASHGAQGLNFHTGDMVGGGDKTLPSRYTAFVTAGQGYDAHPLSYGMKLFDLGSHGKLIPITVTSAPDYDAKIAQSLSAYATLSDDKTVSVTLINKAHGADAAAAQIEIKLAAPGTIKDAQVLFLTAPQGDIAAKADITLGGKSIEQNGRWIGKWSPIKIPTASNTVTLNMPPASAAIIQAYIVQLPTTPPAAQNKTP